MKITIFFYLNAAWSLVSASAGLWCMKNPAGVIRFQQKFYEMINWRIEPIDMDKEIRNTRLMGGFLVFLAILCLTFWRP